MIKRITKLILLAVGVLGLIAYGSSAFAQSKDWQLLKKLAIEQGETIQGHKIVTLNDGKIAIGYMGNSTISVMVRADNNFVLEYNENTHQFSFGYADDRGRPKKRSVISRKTGLDLATTLVSDLVRMGYVQR